jgi:predicted dithiol-disulfide oxidoreductase (DUF899 family)
MKTKEVEKKKKQMNPSIVSAKEWEAARQQLLVKEKEVTHARDALAAERRRMPRRRSMSSTGPRARRVCSTFSTAAVS